MLIIHPELPWRCAARCWTRSRQRLGEQRTSGLVQVSSIAAKVYPTMHRVTWASAVKDGEFDSFKGCSEALTEWADPTKKDKLTSVHVKTEQVKEELVKTLESVLRRGEKIEELVQASTDLSESSKAFYKKSRSLNRCCTIM